MKRPMIVLSTWRISSAAMLSTNACRLKGVISRTWPRLTWLSRHWRPGTCRRQSTAAVIPVTVMASASDTATPTMPKSSTRAVGISTQRSRVCAMVRRLTTSIRCTPTKTCLNTFSGNPTARVLSATIPTITAASGRSAALMWNESHRIRKNRANPAAATTPSSAKNASPVETTRLTSAVSSVAWCLAT